MSAKRCPKCGFYGFGDCQYCARIERDEWKSRAEAAEAEVARLNGATYNPHPAQLKVLYTDQCRAITEAALRWAWKDSHKAHTMAPYLHDLKRGEYITRGLAALLGEGK